VSDAQDRIAAIEAKRAARKAAASTARDEQRAADLERLDELECEHGDSNVSCLDFDFQPGLPTMVIVVAPKRMFIRRYQDRIKPKKDGRQGDAQEAAEELAAVSIAYPDVRTEEGREVFERMLEHRAGLKVQCGGEALKLAVGREQDSGKG
jgi:hypothetical protein